MPIRQQFGVFVTIVVLYGWNAVLGSTPLAAQNRRPVPVLLDTDIGGFVDDVFALGVVASRPEFELLGVTTVGQHSKKRALIACRFLEEIGRSDVPVAWGRDPQPQSELDGQSQYANHPAVVFGRTKQPLEETAVELMRKALKRRPGQVTIIAIGPLTNVARLLQQHPECRAQIKRILFRGGRLYQKTAKPLNPRAEWNVAEDIQAARRLVNSGVPLGMVPFRAASKQVLPRSRVEGLRERLTSISLQHVALYQLSNKPQPELFDIVAAWYAQRDWQQACDEHHVEIDDAGITWLTKNAKKNVCVFRKPNDIVDWALESIDREGAQVVPRELATVSAINASMLESFDRMPARVHVVEDYDTDIEKRWWLAGVIDVLGARPGGRRCCRSVLTKDFDDKMGDSKSLYSAVVFNPVPGPPMGNRTHLSFRYRMQGDYPLRVQLYSLSKGYHRYLSVKQLKQDVWSPATVDLTQMRRHDGSGGPLSEGERIDDIQFYADPRARFWIDDIVLHEPAAEEKLAFPKHVIFTGGFDTGKQGKEWPGDFLIVSHEAPRTWKTAQAVVHPRSGDTWMRVHMRGRRLLRPRTRLRFSYRCSGNVPLKVTLVDRKVNHSYERTIERLVARQWSQAEVEYDFPGPGQIRFADEIRFTAPPESELWIDDLLLYEPDPRVASQN